MQFCVEVIDIASMLRADSGVLSAASLALTKDASVAAAALLNEARLQAQLLREQAVLDAQAAVRQREQQSLLEVQALLQALEKRHAAMLHGVQDTVLDLAAGLFGRLVAEMPPTERIAAALQCVLAEAPPKLVAPVLRVHPEDLALLPATAWDVKADPRLSRGCCRLEADSGEWCCSFDAAVRALSTALSRAAAMPPG